MWEKNLGRSLGSWKAEAGGAFHFWQRQFVTRAQSRTCKAKNKDATSKFMTRKFPKQASKNVETRPGISARYAVWKIKKQYSYKCLWTQFEFVYPSGRSVRLSVALLCLSFSTILCRLNSFSLIN